MNIASLSLEILWETIRQGWILWTPVLVIWLLMSGDKKKSPQNKPLPEKIIDAEFTEVPERKPYEPGDIVDKRA